MAEIGIIVSLPDLKECRGGGGGYPLPRKVYSFRQRETLWGNTSLFADQFYKYEAPPPPD